MTVVEKSESVMISQRPGITGEMIQLAIGMALQDSAFSEMDTAQKSVFADEINRVYYQGIEAGTLVGRLCYHTLSLDQIEALDGIGYQIDRIHKKACEKWVVDFNIQPPLPIGELIEEGEITGISEYDPATYLVKPYGQDDATSNRRRRLIRFEDAKKIDVVPDNWVKHDPSQDQPSVKSAPLCIQSADWLETLALAVKGKACDLYFEHAVYINRFDQIESPELQKRLADNLRTAVGDQLFNSTVHGVLVNGGLMFINMPSVAEKVLKCLMHNAELKEAGLFVAHFDRNGDLIETN
jgi:hypothetical protein